MEEGILDIFAADASAEGFPKERASLRMRYAEPMKGVARGRHP